MAIVKKITENIVGPVKGDIITEQMDKAKSKKVSKSANDIVGNIL